MTTALFFLSLVWASRLFPGKMNQETYDRYWMAMELTRGYRWPTQVICDDGERWPNPV